MLVPILNIVIGVLLILGGASGRFTFIGTDNSTALIVVGGAIAAWGLFQAVRSRPSKE